MKSISVNLKTNPYNIYIGRDIIKKVPSDIKKLNLGNYGIIITSSKVYSLYKTLINSTFKRQEYKIIQVADGEKAKSKKWLFEVIDKIIEADGWNKKLFIVCLGGGTVGDLGGFSASIYKRGIPCVQIPTTLLSQIDASIGGKTAIDLPKAKNVLGTFFQPKAVFIDPCFLSTLPFKEIKEGLAEAIKYAIIKDEKFFYFLQNNRENIIKLEPSCILKIISVCAGIKANIVEEDEKESKGIRTILNFGHTFAHALESSSRYNKISHGRAVSLGMVYAAQLSFLLKKCGRKDLRELIHILNLFSLPTKIKFDPIKVYESLIYDKKFISGKIRMVLLDKIGKAEVVERLKPEKIKEILKDFSSSFIDK
ncbi:MAG: 3-dehydroquinate synthase [Candidatus Omnitrophota bacterium]